MTCYNAGPYVGESIKSVISQTYSNIELIFVDDKSSDNSLEIAREIQKFDGRIKIFANKSNLGVSKSRNLAFTKATGKWLAILDADDVFVQNKLEKQINFINSTNLNLSIIGTSSFLIDESGREFAKYKYPNNSIILKQNLINQKPFPPHSSLMYCASAVRSIGGFNYNFLLGEDIDLCLRLSEYGDIACLSEPLVKHRRHSTNISKSIHVTGHSIFEYSVAATVCHLLRQHNMNDPSLTLDPSIWRKFMQHISDFTITSGEDRFLKWKKNLRNEKNNILLTALLFYPKYAFRLIFNRLYGNKFAYKLFKSWLEINF